MEDVAAATGGGHSVLVRDDGEAIGLGRKGDGECAVPKSPRVALPAPVPRPLSLSKTSPVEIIGYKTATSALPIVGLRHTEGELWATASSASFAGWSSPGALSLAKVVVTA